jgi:type I restriction enzyme M protein
MGIEGLYDCVITNIPFSQNIDLNTSAYYYDGLAKKSGDGVCMLHCFKSVRKGGRMALIVPEGVLFKKTLSPIRKFLLENARLETVISLPQGVFLPYTGVKTSILYFTGCHESNSKEGVRFYEVKNDGFSLNNHRRPIELNDLKYIDYVDFSKSLHTDIQLTTNSLGESLGFQKVEYEDIKQNEYNLIFNRYSQACVGVARLQSVGKKGWEMVRLGDENYFTVIMGSSPPSEFYNNTGLGIPFFQGSKDFGALYPNVNTYCSQPIKIAEKMDILLSVRAPVGDINITNTTCCIGRGLSAIRSKQNILPMYLFYALKNTKIKTTIASTFESITKNDVLDIEIPLPPLETQKKIVEELDNIQKGIDCLNEAIDSLKKQVNLDSFRFAHYFDGDV